MGDGLDVENRTGTRPGAEARDGEVRESKPETIIIDLTNTKLFEQLRTNPESRNLDPISDIAGDVRRELSRFIRAASVPPARMGLTGEKPSAISIERLDEFCSAASLRCEDVLTMPAEAPQDLAFKNIANILQSKLDSFVVLLRSASDGKRLPLGEVGDVVQSGLQLRCDLSVMMIEAEAVAMGIQIEE